jgi:hypothetical protein
VDPEGGLELLRPAPPGDLFPAEPPLQWTQVKAELRQSGPSLNRPTPAYLQALPTDPATLYARSPTSSGAAAGGTMRADLVFKNSLQLLALSNRCSRRPPGPRTSMHWPARRRGSRPGTPDVRGPRRVSGPAGLDFGTGRVHRGHRYGRIIGGYATAAPGDPLEHASTGSTPSSTPSPGPLRNDPWAHSG